MEDTKILELYFEREESAIVETARKYGNYCLAIAVNILHSREDSDECVNDTYLRAWEAIPPTRPSPLRIYLGKITRNLSLDRYKRRKSQKRAADETALLFSELGECIPGAASAEAEYEAAQLESEINSALRAMPQESRVIFIRRYFFAESIREISERFNMKEGKIKTVLFRARKRLKNDLEKAGVFV